MIQPTTEKLAQAMIEAGCPQIMIERARFGHYDDFKSDLATPIIQLVNDLRSLGFDDLAERAIAGEFDATDQESDAWFEAEGRDLLLGDLVIPRVNRPKPKGFG